MVDRDTATISLPKYRDDMIAARETARAALMAAIDGDATVNGEQKMSETDSPCGVCLRTECRCPARPSASPAPAGSGEAVRAFQIADEAMLKLAIPGWPLCGGDTFRLQRFVSHELHKAVDWLESRGYVKLDRDDSGEFIRILREPGADHG